MRLKVLGLVGLLAMVTYEVNGREYQVEFGGTFSLCNRKKVCPGLDL